VVEFGGNTWRFYCCTRRRLRETVVADQKGVVVKRRTGVVAKTRKGVVVKI
jgi:hypothetical protein